MKYLLTLLIVVLLGCKKENEYISCICNKTNAVLIITEPIQDTIPLNATSAKIANNSDSVLIAFSILQAPKKRYFLKLAVNDTIFIKDDFIK